MSKNKEITIEGYSVDELLSLTELEVEHLAFNNKPITFRVGSAEILGQFNISADGLVVELAHIDGGGEGVLTTIWSLAEQFARKLRLRKVEWIVDAVHCANPNLKLRRVLELKGFKIESLGGAGEAYHYVQDVDRDQEQ